MSDAIRAAIIAGWVAQSAPGHQRNFGPMLARIEAMEARHGTRYDASPTPADLAALAQPVACCDRECCRKRA